MDEVASGGSGCRSITTKACPYREDALDLLDDLFGPCLANVHRRVHNLRSVKVWLFEGHRCSGVPELSSPLSLWICGALEAVPAPPPPPPGGQRRETQSPLPRCPHGSPHSRTSSHCTGRSCREANRCPIKVGSTEARLFPRKSAYQTWTSESHASESVTHQPNA